MAARQGGRKLSEKEQDLVFQALFILPCSIARAMAEANMGYCALPQQQHAVRGVRSACA
jgi:hypothetical protein